MNIFEILNTQERMWVVLVAIMLIMVNCDNLAYYKLQKLEPPKPAKVSLVFNEVVKVDTVLDTTLVKDWLYKKAYTKTDSIIIGVVYYSDRKVAQVTRVLSLICVESGIGADTFNESSGAHGLMQILPSTARLMKLNYDSLGYVDYAIMGGVKTLRAHYKYANYNIDRGINDYAGGGYNDYYLRQIEKNVLWKYMFKKQTLEWLNFGNYHFNK